MFGEEAEPSGRTSSCPSAEVAAEEQKRVVIVTVFNFKLHNTFTTLILPLVLVKPCFGNKEIEAAFEIYPRGGGTL